MKHPHYQVYVAEAIGTCFLTCAVLTSLTIHLPLATAVMAGLTLGLFVYSIGSISGAHLNPAVTMGLWTVGKIHAEQAMGYILAQVIGAVVAMQAHIYWLNSYPSVEISNSLHTAASEAAGAFLLVFTISAVVHKKMDDAASGIAIGGALTLGALLASIASNGVLNPAVAIGIGSVSLAYLLGPLLGGILGAVVYKWLVSKK